MGVILSWTTVISVIGNSLSLIVVRCSRNPRASYLASGTDGGRRFNHHAAVQDCLLVNIAHSRKFYNRRWRERDERPPDGLSLLNLRSNSDCTPRVGSTSDVRNGRRRRMSISPSVVSGR